MGSREATLEMIERELRDRHGSAYAQHWLAQQSPSGTKLASDKGVVADASNVPLRPASEVANDLPGSNLPDAAPTKALGSLEAEAKAVATELRNQVTFKEVKMRSDRRSRVMQFHINLVHVALEVAARRSYRKASSVTLHTVMELVGICLGIKSSSTLYSYLHTLKELGLVDFKGYVTTINREDASGANYSFNRCNGTLLCIRLGGYKPAKLNRFDFEVSCRDLQADIDQKRTAFRLIQQLEESQIQKDNSADIHTVAQWSLDASILFVPLRVDSSTSEGVIRDDYPKEILAITKSTSRNRDVDLTAYKLSCRLNDRESLNFYRKLLWQLLKTNDKGLNLSEGLYHMANRVLAGVKERSVHSPGALLITHLKAERVWEELCMT